MAADGKPPKEPRPSARGLPCAKCGEDRSVNWCGKGAQQYCGKYECKKAAGIAGVKRKRAAASDCGAKSREQLGNRKPLERGGAALLPVRADFLNVPDDLYTWRKEEKHIAGLNLNTVFSYKILNVRRDKADDWWALGEEATYSFLVKGVFEDYPGSWSQELVELDETTAWLSNMVDNCHDSSVVQAAVRFMEKHGAHEADVTLLRSTQSWYIR